MTLSRLLGSMLIFSIFFCQTGCISISSGQINFEGLKYPVSMSNTLYGPDSNVVGPNNGLKVIKTFEYNKPLWRTFYSYVELTKNSIITEQINKEIETAGGDGMIGVSVSSSYDAFNAAFPLTLLPFWPSCTKISITGDIVKLEQKH